MNSTAQQHALEQANLITQLIKYADRVIVVESASDAERRAFVKLIDDQLPESVGVLALRASPNTEQAEIIREISALLQLSPGIEAPRQLAAAIQAALGSQGRLLTIVENADAWYQTTQWSGLIAHIQAANKTAPNHWLFLLTGAPGLTDKLRNDAQLTDLSAELHRCELLGAADASSAIASSAPPSSSPDVAAEFHAEDRFVAAAPPPKKSHGTALLVAAALSIAVVTFGGFALLTRSHDAPSSAPTTQTLALTQSAAPVPPPTAPAQTDNPLPNDGANSTPQQPVESAPAALIPPKPAATSVAAPPADNPPVSPPSVLVPPTPVVTAPTQAAQAEPKPAAAISEASARTAEASVVPPSEKPEAMNSPRAPTSLEKPTHEVHAPSKSKPSQLKPEKPAHQAASPAASHAVAARVTGADNAWYRQQKPERAALQLGAFNEEKAALAFIKTHAVHGSLNDWHLFTQKRGGQTLFTVTAGNFSNLRDARDDIEHLPAAMKKLKPYPRSFKAITEVIQ